MFNYTVKYAGVYRVTCNFIIIVYCSLFLIKIYHNKFFFLLNNDAFTVIILILCTDFLDGFKYNTYETVCSRFNCLINVF